MSHHQSIDLQDLHPTFQIRHATSSDLPALTDIYNHYILNSTATYDYQTVTPEQRRPWFEAFDGKRWILLVAVISGTSTANSETDIGETVVAYACAQQYNLKPGYDRTALVSIYVAPQAQKKGLGRRLYHSLIDEIKVRAAVTIKLFKRVF